MLSYIIGLIRSSIDNIINLIPSLFSNMKPAITLEDANLKYALKLIDKEADKKAEPVIKPAKQVGMITEGQVSLLCCRSSKL
ncbi:hypothetical protein DPEC_G00116060 [Dallia pectoralis]|uniref:Uncharacterized protein n=1 Tax=Dallia pectoralis TaxID=75939 RepID=A0ACC2GV05_DALPE|nr:hypothetical protein DPEC_G00116060 [Dallia pectoralis]